jgi:hypothetical protein
MVTKEVKKFLIAMALCNTVVPVTNAEGISSSSFLNTN